MQYRAVFPIEFPEKPGKSIANSALYCIFPDPGNLLFFQCMAVKSTTKEIQARGRSKGWYN